MIEYDIRIEQSYEDSIQLCFFPESKKILFTS